MTSKNSFLVDSKENHKRRIWVWIVSLLGQLAAYPGILTVYFSRIHYLRQEGVYNVGFQLQEDFYRQALEDAAADGLGFQPDITLVGLLLGALIAVQGFAYLYDRKKVDMYHSVPVSSKRRFLVVYINGILIYVIPNILSVLAGIGIATTQGAVTGRVLTECGLAFVMNLLYFLIVYHLAILAVMLTGNVIITGCALMTFLFIGYVWYILHDAMKDIFFVTNDSFFSRNGNCYSIVIEYLQRTNEFKLADGLLEIGSDILPLYGRWVICAGLVFALAYFCYQKRPAEAAGKAIAFPVIKPFVKIVISVTIGIFICFIAYEKTYYNMPVTVLALFLGTIFCCGVMEVIFEFDIRAAVRHLVSTGVGAVFVLILFCIYCFDLFGYDDYIPDADQVESVAIQLAGYQNYWEWSEDRKQVTSVSNGIYLRDNMFLTDVGAVCELAGKSKASLIGHSGNAVNWDMEDGRDIHVLYRLKSGREVNRCFQIDFADPSNEELLNRLIGTKEYRESFYQIMKEGDVLASMQKSLKISYSNGPIISELPASDAEALRTAWMQDMEQYDFTLAGGQRPCGVLEWGLQSEYITWSLPVYESFTNTVTFLKERDAWYPVELRAEDIASLEITNYHYDEQLELEASQSQALGRESAQAAAVKAMETTSQFFEDPEEIAEILKAIYPMDLELNWNDSRTLDRNYYVEISFKRTADRPYSMGYFRYRFLNGQVPGFVAERTAYQVSQ